MSAGSREGATPQRLEGDPPAPARTYTYRREPTEGGLDKMRRGELKHFDLEMYANLNTGVLEEYLEEKNRREGFARSAWDSRKILVGIAVGTLFALINTYVGLKIGLIVYGAWYVAYLIGMGFRWKPAAINLSAGAANGTSFIVTGFVYVFPAIYLLSAHNNGQYEPLIGAAAIPPIPVAIVATVVAGLLGVMYFIVFRRIWLVEDPLPYPSFESFVKLLDMTNDLSEEAAERARHAVRLVLTFTGLAALFTFLRDFPIIRASAGAEPVPVFSHLARDKAWYSSANGIAVPESAAHYTWANFTLSPLLLATGWFMRARAAFLVAMGTLFVWFVAIPLAVFFDMPVFRASLGGEVGLETLWQAGHPSALLAFTGLFRTMAAGAILGGGLTALLKMAPTIRSVTADLFRIEPDGSSAYVPGRGWYEWPPVHILVMLAVAAVAIPLTFHAGGYPIVASLVFTIILLTTAFLLGAIAVKVLGETSIEPVSGTSFIVFLMLFGAFRLLGMPVETTVAMGLLGTSVYASSIAMTGDVLLDFKNAIYVGTTPHAQLKAQIAGIVPGAIAGVLAATLLSQGLANGSLQLAAPQANAFATLVQAIVGGEVDYSLFFLGLAIGVFVEVLTGMGTAFGLGMFLPVGIVGPLLVGGVARDLWERKVLDANAEKLGWNEEKKTIRLLDTYMVATGLIVGEALLGTVIAIYLSTGLILGG